MKPNRELNWLRRDLDAVETRLQELDAMHEHTPKLHREVEALEVRQAELLREIEQQTTQAA